FSIPYVSRVCSIVVVNITISCHMPSSASRVRHHSLNHWGAIRDENPRIKHRRANLAKKEVTVKRFSD
ncbi:MAG: hypothetical protein ACRD63_11330, partial [Pyrinomonadaceae bacterium]